jgi:hypothetical protein
LYQTSCRASTKPPEMGFLPHLRRSWILVGNMSGPLQGVAGMIVLKESIF